MTGIYIHIPWCRSKCNYCDFYSIAPVREDLSRYTDAVLQAAREYKGTPADTVYFGGGNPMLLGEASLCALLKGLREIFALQPESEITLEANPEDIGFEGLCLLRENGFNRISIGVQSLNDRTLRLLGRRHDAAAAQQAIRTAVRAGFSHISADLMLALPDQTIPEVRTQIQMLAELGIDHLSAYLLKIEPDTPFGAAPPPLLPDEDIAADLYLAACDACAQNGLAQYEISNFARPGGQSRHNLKYWLLEPYLGFGPAAHSFFNGRRFYYPRSLSDFLANPQCVCQDGPGGGPEEHIALSLRLSQGIPTQKLAQLPHTLYAKFSSWANAGLCRYDQLGLRLTPAGFLVSNELIAEILAEM